MVRDDGAKERVLTLLGKAVHELLKQVFLHMPVAEMLFSPIRLDFTLFVYEFIAPLLDGRFGGCFLEFID